MNKPKYEVNYSAFDEIYTFVSLGKNGAIQKAVQLYEYKENVYNLGFGDLDQLTGAIDDKSESGNGDAEMVLATVVGIAIDFLERNPMANITFEGNSKSRNRLYQMALNIYYEEFSERLEIFGSIDGNLEVYQKSKKYESFLIRKLL
jgi:hypothetical protein